MACVEKFDRFHNVMIALGLVKDDGLNCCQILPISDALIEVRSFSGIRDQIAKIFQVLTERLAILDIFKALVCTDKLMALHLHTERDYQLRKTVWVIIIRQDLGPDLVNILAG